MKRPGIRLLIVSTVPRTLKAFLLPFADHFRAMGWHVDAMCGPGGELDSVGSHFNEIFMVPWARTLTSPASALRAFFVVRRVLASHRYDLLHVHTPIAAFVTRVAIATLPRNQRPRVVYTAHGFHFHRLRNPMANAAFIALEKLAGPWTDSLVVMNHDDMAAAVTFSLVPPTSVKYIPGIGIDLRHYSRSEAERLELRVNLPSQHSALFLQIGHLDPEKRHSDAIRAIACIKDPAVHLCCAGDGPLLARLKQLANDLGVDERVHFLGQCPDVRPLLCRATALLVPSVREGLPRSILEALALRCPVIGADVRGIRDLLKDGGGTLFPAGDVGALCRAMDRAMRRVEHTEFKSLCPDMGQFEIGNILQQYGSIYRALLGGLEMVAR